MNAETFTKKDINYLQRCCSECKPTSTSSLSSIQAHLIFWNLEAVGYSEKSVDPKEKRYSESDDHPIRLPSEDILVGLYGIGKPFAFFVEGKPDNASIYLGAWSPNNSFDIDSNVLFSVFNSLYPFLKSKSIKDIEMESYTKAGLVLGIPTIKNPDFLDGALPIDRLIRAMTGGNWLCTIFAEPWPLENLENLRDKIFDDLEKTFYKYKDVSSLPACTAHCNEILKSLLASYSQSLSIGSWRTTVYILGDDTSYGRLSNVWKSIFLGDQSISEPIRVWDNSMLSGEYINFLDLAVNYKIIDERGVPSQSINLTYRHPFRYQTLLSSSQLAAYIHLPKYETSGFKVTMTPDFDVVPPDVHNDNSIEIGKIFNRGHLTNASYYINLPDLTRHALVVGVTGSGKTNTCFSILKNLWQMKIPFLVIEPAKTEYRALINDSIIGPDLRVFTLGRELLSPFRLNPFEFEDGVLLSTHIDLLKSVFNAAFSMWTVLPQILEQALYRVYQEYSWDIVRNENVRFSDQSCGRLEAFPILSDLQSTISQLVDSLGYESKTTSEIKAALITRIQSLRIGGKGKMLDTRQSFSMQEILKKPTIFELEDIGDDDEKAFIIGLIMVKLYEHLRGNKIQIENNLKHLVVVEEAHRLLANVPTKASSEEANARGKAVETFVNMLSEVRAYGEGFLVAEQIPTKLAPDLIKNTNLKIVHRTVEGNERAVVSQAMNMRDRHSDMLATLNVGEAVVFAEGDDLPIMIKTPKFERKQSKMKDTDAQFENIISNRIARHFPECSLNCHAGCAKYMKINVKYCENAQKCAENKEFQRLISYLLVSTIERPLNFFEILPKIVDWIKTYFGNTSLNFEQILSTFIHAFDTNIRNVAKFYNWSFSVICKLKELLISNIVRNSNMLSSCKLNQESEFNSEELEQFHTQFNLNKLCIRKFDPFPFCRSICNQSPSPLCLYNYHVDLLLNDPKSDREFLTAMQNSKDQNDMFEKLRTICLEACSNLLVVNCSNGDYNKFALCYSNQKFSKMERIPLELREKLISFFIIYINS